jgi:endonuclease/exonuclease/phosphatase family metal-dependent hydrolase
MEVANDALGTFSDAIDHVIFKGSGITFGNYDILTDDASASLSDHMPVVVDFSFSK